MPAPIKHTCPDIDRCIKMLKSIASTAKDGMKHTDAADDNYQRFKDCEWDIDDIIGNLEELRKSNHALRQWGEELEENAKSLENQLEE